MPKPIKNEPTIGLKADFTHVKNSLIALVFSASLLAIWMLLP